nr:hypothetical protein Ymer_51 [Pectobacterium phage Ymer]
MVFFAVFRIKSYTLSECIIGFIVVGLVPIAIIKLGWMLL